MHHQNYPPGAMFQGGQQKAQGMKPGGMTGAPTYGGMGGGISSASGVPFYGQQNKMMAPTMGGLGGAGAFSAGGFGGQPSGGGGFTYGMASKGGNLFGPPGGAAASNNLFNAGGNSAQFGAGAQTQNNGLFQFGSVSQFGGLGGGAGSLFGGGGGVSAGAADDPYANIALDLNKVKKQEPPPKLYEHKTEEEKKKEASAKTAQAANTKSNLKKDMTDTKQNTSASKPAASQSQLALDDDKKKRNVTFGKSTTYEVEAGSEDDSGEFQTKDLHKEGKGSPRPGGTADKKVIAEKDLSDGRSEKEKILEMLEKKQREQLEEINEMNQWKSKQEESKKPSSVYDDSVGDSSLSNQIPQPVQQKKPTHQVEQSSGSYESDDFEDVSASGSGSRSKFNFNPNNQSAAGKATSYDPKAMEEYMKKQKMNQISSSKPPISVDEQSESSEKYEEDFDSMSKSQTGLTSSLLPSPHQSSTQQQQKGKNVPFDYKQPVEEYKSQLQKYVKKENRFVQTDLGKYSFINPADIEPSSYKEWTLTQNLKDAEELIQELKSSQAESKQRIFDAETQYKKKDVEFQSMRREALNAQETSKRLQEQLKDSMHKINLYKIETEELIKQIDLADAKTREKEDELKLCQAEYERKLKLQEERILFRQSKQEERETYELKRQHMIEREELQKKIQDQQEEIDYFNQKVTKIEAENRSLRLGKDQNTKIKELEEQVELLRASQNSGQVRFQADPSKLKTPQSKDLTKEEQIKLQREVQHLELMVKGYQEESEKTMLKNKGHQHEIKTLQDKLLAEQKKVKELQQKSLLDHEKVYVEEAKEELDIDTVNIMGLSNAISQKQLAEIHSQLQKLQNERLDADRDFNIKEAQLKSQINKVREEKAAIEKQLYDTEFLLGEKNTEVQKIRDEMISQRQSLNERIEELEEKVKFFRKNQKLLSDQDEKMEETVNELSNLRDKIKSLEDQARLAKDLEKKCKLLEEALKQKNPNSIPLMIQAAKETNQNANISEKGEVIDLKKQIKQLEYQLEQKDSEYEKKLRTLRQEAEKVRGQYENKKGMGPDAKRVQELEHELETTKTYYNKRIREIEEKNRFKAPIVDSKKETSKAAKNQNNVPPIKQEAPQSIDIKVYEDQIEKLTKERNLLAQKVVNLETLNNKRRDQQQNIDYPSNAIYSIVNMIKQVSDIKDLTMNLIEAALICVEFIKDKDPAKNKQFSQLLLNLTQDLQNTGKCNEKVLSELIDASKAAGEATPPQELRRQTSNSQSDLHQSQPINFYPSPKQEQMTFKNPFHISSADSNAVSPPTPTSKKFQGRTASQILKVISHLDFERLAKSNKSFNPRSLQVNQLYQLINGENIKITVDEVKILISHVKELSGGNATLVGAVDSVDIHDLTNALMDQSVESHQEDAGLLPSHRYSQDGGAPLNRNATTVNNEKIEKLQKMVYDLQAERRGLIEKVEKLEQGKSRMERILKQNLTSKKDGGPSSDVLEELGLLMKRLEYLEQQSDERQQSQYLDHNICNRQIQQLQQEVEQERNDKLRMLTKKNQEVAYFKAELDGLLGELEATAINKKRSTKA